jgi:hypothetical protein
MHTMTITDRYRHIQFGLGKLLILPVLVAFFFGVARQCGYISATIALSSLVIFAIAYQLSRVVGSLSMRRLAQILFAISLWFSLVDKVTCSYYCPKCFCVWHITSYQIIGIPVTTAYLLNDVTGKVLTGYPACPRDSLVLGRELRWWGLMIESDLFVPKEIGSIPARPYTRPCE